MSGIGSSEFILLLVIGLIVLGPKRLPEVANTIGGWIGQARRMTRVMKRQLEEELNFDEHRNILPPTPPFTESPSKPATPGQGAADAGTTPGGASADADEAPAVETQNHIPSDDDTYSPLHAEEDAGDAAADGGTPKEQGA